MNNTLSSEDYVNKLFWLARYSDGTQVTSKTINSKDLDRPRIKSISIIDSDDNVIYTQHYNKYQLPLYRARMVMTENIGPIDRIHLLGWINTSGTIHITYIYESDFHIESGGYNIEGNPYSSQIILSDSEKEYLASLK